MRLPDRFTPFPSGAACIAVAGALLLASCASPPRALTPEDYAVRLPQLEARVAATPDDPAARAELGEALVQTGAFARGRDELGEAERGLPTDPRVTFYLGAAEEGLDRPREALRYYARYASLPARSSWRRLLARRYDALLRQTVRAEMAGRIANEDSLAYADEVTDAVAVFPLTLQGGDSLYAPLGRGLSEMLTVDLASVDRVRVVERVRLQALLGELELSQGAAFDAATAPRLGRLLRSAHVVGGAFAIQTEAMRTDVALWAWPREPLPGLTTRQGRLADLFALQNEIAFGVLRQLGVELTAAERDAIERIPTRNLEAFLAYSRGLLEEDAGRYARAAAHYAEAARLDPRFAEASERAEEVAELAGGLGDALALARGFVLRRGGVSSLGADPQPPGGSTSLVEDRLATLTSTLGGVVIPGEGSRDPTGEVPVVTPAGPTRGTYPEPPLPPGN